MTIQLVIHATYRLTHFENTLFCTSLTYIKSNVKKNNTKSHRNEYRQKNENPTNPKKSMDLPANNACFQADSFMSERIVGRD